MLKNIIHHECSIKRILEYSRTYQNLASMSETSLSVTELFLVFLFCLPCLGLKVIKSSFDMTVDDTFKNVSI